MYLYLRICISLPVNVKRLLMSFVGTDPQPSSCLWQGDRLVLVQLQWELRLWFIPPHPLKLGSGTVWACPCHLPGELWHRSSIPHSRAEMLLCFWLLLQTAEHRIVLKLRWPFWHCLQGFQQSSEFSSCLILVCVLTLGYCRVPGDNLHIPSVCSV